MVRRAYPTRLELDSQKSPLILARHPSGFSHYETQISLWIHSNNNYFLPVITAVSFGNALANASITFLIKSVGSVLR